MPVSKPASLSFLAARLDLLRRTQNGDGGWGYFTGNKTSWLEPTAYAAMALLGEPAADRAWAFLRTLQNADGGWRPAASIANSAWGTSLCVTLGLARGDFGDTTAKGVRWLVDLAGAESKWYPILLAYFFGERDFSLKAWPWRPGNSAWVEPTAHALVALKQAESKFDSKALRGRIKQGEAQLIDVRSKDGGWNYGARTALGFELPSYAETTALALLALQDRADVKSGFETAERYLAESPSTLARAWLTIARRLHELPAPKPSGEAGRDLMLTAVEALAAPEGNHRIFKTWNS